MNIFVVNITQKLEFVGFCGCLRNHFFMSIPGNTEYMGNYKAIILHESDEYSVAFYKNLKLVYGPKN